MGANNKKMPQVPRTVILMDSKCQKVHNSMIFLKTKVQFPPEPPAVFLPYKSIFRFIGAEALAKNGVKFLANETR